MDKSNSILVIVNPCSGKGKGAKIAPKVKKMFADNGFQVDILFTQKQGDATEYAKNATSKVVVAIGGDGTLNETITGLMQNDNKLTLGYIPLGSTNDFAKSMGIPFCWKSAAKAIITGEERVIDVCRFNEKYFSYVAAYGMFAETSCSVNQKLKNKLGHMAYLLLGVKEVFRKNKFDIDIEVDGKRISGTYAFLGFGNTKSIGGLLKFKDTIVQMRDGLFEVFLVKYPKSLWQLSRMLKKFYKSEWVGDGLELYHAKEVKVYNNGSMLWSLDGEKNILKENASITIVPDAIKILIRKK